MSKINFVKSKRLNDEVICVVADTQGMELDKQGQYKGHVVYTQEEVAKLKDIKPDDEVLRAIHEVKRQCGGFYTSTLQCS